MFWQKCWYFFGISLTQSLQTLNGGAVLKPCIEKLESMQTFEAWLFLSQHFSDWQTNCLRAFYSILPIYKSSLNSKTGSERFCDFI